MDILGSVEDRRSADRVKELRSGVAISVDGTRREPCVVDNLSETGALLIVEQPLQFPGEVVLVIDGEKVRRPAHVTRRHNNTVAVSFVTKQSERNEDGDWVFPPAPDRS